MDVGGGIQPRDAVDARGECGFLRWIRIRRAMFRLLRREDRGAKQRKRDDSANRVGRHAISVADKAAIKTKMNLLKSGQPANTDLHNVRNLLQLLLQASQRAADGLYPEGRSAGILG